MRMGEREIGTVRVIVTRYSDNERELRVIIRVQAHT